MAVNLVSLVMECLTPDTIGRIASALGLDRTNAQSAVGTAVPSLLAAFSNVAAQPGGAQKLADISSQRTGVLEGFSNMLGTGNQSSLIESGTQMLSSLLGSRDQNALSGAIGRFTGMGQSATGSLLGMLAPMVLGTISRQLGPRLDPGAISNLLAGQRDNIAAALPSGFANELGRAGLLDSLGGAARTAAAAAGGTMRASASAASSAADTAWRAGGTGVTAATPSSMNWLYWLIPAAAVAALLIYLVGSTPEQVAQNKPVEPPAKTVEQSKTVTQNRPAEPSTTVGQNGTVGQAMTTASLEVNKQVTDTITGLRTTLGGINDAASAHAALPKLQEASAQMDKINGLTGQLSPDGKKALTSVISPTMPALNQLFDKVLAVPGAAEELKPTIDALKTKLAALAA
jgi:hypothetical protein